MEAFEFFIPQNIMVGAGSLKQESRGCPKKEEHNKQTT